RDEDDLLNAGGEMAPELLRAFIDRAENCAILGGFAPGRVVPFLAEPIHHGALDAVARFTDHDRQLRGIEQSVRVPSGLAGEAANFHPSLSEALGGVEIGEPAVR